MSLIPMLVDLAHELDDYHPLSSDSFFDNDFGFGIYPGEIFRPRATSSMMCLSPRQRYRPYNRRNLLARNRHNLDSRDMQEFMSLKSNVGKDGFQVCMDVSHFKPNELVVKTVENQVVIEGKHEEREDQHGSVTRHFVRKYQLPKGYDAKEVVSTISSDGVLTVKAPPPQPKAVKDKERIIQIQQTGPAHLSIKDTNQPDDQNGDDNKKETKK